MEVNRREQGRIKYDSIKQKNRITYNTTEQNLIKQNNIKTQQHGIEQHMKDYNRTETDIWKK